MNKKQQILDHWNEKKIIVHRKLSPDASTEITRILKYYTVEEIQEFIDFYATILEVGVPDHEKKYFWTYKWNLYEFLKRGIKSFDGKELDNYLKKRSTDYPVKEALVLRRDL